MADTSRDDGGRWGRGSDWRPLLGYCTNVHPGESLAQVKENLVRHAAAVKDRVSPGSLLPIGLWLSRRAARELIGDDRALDDFRDFLGLHGLRVFTFNAFPVGGFHGRTVKHRVYRPDWSEYERLEYTVAIAEIARDLAPEGDEVSISTLPLGWGKGGDAACDVETAARGLRAVAARLQRIEQDTGRLIHLDLEPEPGCTLDTAADIVGLFEGPLLKGGDEAVIRRHIRVCHDICHSAVMFEPQQEALETYSRSGIEVGKVQVSSAVRVDLSQRSGPARGEVVDALAALAEERYLHQAMVRTRRPGGAPVFAFFDDLPAAVDHLRQWVGDGEVECRVHFHVPVFARGLGVLGTTHADIAPAIMRAIDLHGTRHFEVETYSWGVLPASAAGTMPALADGLAQEIRHVRELVPNGFEP